MDFFNLSLILVFYLIAITFLSKVLIIPVTILCTLIMGRYFKSSKEKLENFLVLLSIKKSITVVYFLIIYTFATILATGISIPFVYHLVASYVGMNLNVSLYIIVPIIAWIRNIIMVIYKRDSIKVVINRKK